MTVRGEQLAVSTKKIAIKPMIAPRIICLPLTVLLLTATVAQAQQQTLYRIGYLTNASEIRQNTEEVFRQGLRELGYTEGRNLIIEWRFSKGRLDLLPDLALELVGLKLDCIVSLGVAPTRAVKQATNTIPIVMGNADDDPVRQGLVASLARPGGNVTGFTNIGSDLAGKRLEMIKETLPKVSRVAILFDPKGPGGVGHVRESESVAAALGLGIQRLEVRDPDVLEGAFKAAVKQRADAIIVVTTGLMVAQRARIINLAAQRRLPAMYTSSLSVLPGGLMSFSDDPQDRSRRVATYVHKILRGTKPADLPVQQPTKFELFVNLKAAKQIGLTIPANVLARADRVIR